MASGDKASGAPGFVLKPWELHGEGREFEKVGRELAKAVGALERGLAALGAPWGTDGPGGAFAAAWGPAHGELAGGLRGLSTRLGQVGAGLHAMAGRTADADTSAATGFGAGAAVPPRPATPGAAPTVPTDMSV
ncbi:hypothetical protein VM98_17290 [Streptomyces rubellomurinus subsp. indigoferus]|nr:hypothetical protein VM98_17290 [Streptomyces rubellomurinus subsp. indigoferus]